MKTCCLYLSIASFLLFGQAAFAGSDPQSAAGDSGKLSSQQEGAGAFWARGALEPSGSFVDPQDDCPVSTAQLVDFGLSQAQREQLYTVSDNSVDLRDIYRLTPGARSSISACKDSLAYLGEVPPVLSPVDGITVPSNGAYRAEEVNSGAGDPALAGQWWLDALKVPEAWGLATGKGVTIADCDSGFFTKEPDLAANLLIDERRDFADDRRPTVVDDGLFVFHGTAVAAILAGVRDGRGTNGIAFDAKVIPLQNFNYDRSLDNSDKEEATARCILHALRLPSVRIILIENQTAQGSSETFVGTREAVRLAVKSGITVISAAGNSSLELRTEEQLDSGSIIVGAVRRNRRRALFSNWGRRVTISAFGEGVRTLYGQNGQLEVFGGTTAAAAQVAAAVALMLEVNPGLTPAQVRAILVETRHNTNENSPVGGVLDVHAAVLRAREVPADTTGRTAQDHLLHLVRNVLSENDSAN